MASSKVPVTVGLSTETWGPSGLNEPPWSAVCTTLAELQTLIEQLGASEEKPEQQLAAVRPHDAVSLNDVPLRRAIYSAQMASQALVSVPLQVMFCASATGLTLLEHCCVSAAATLFVGSRLHHDGQLVNRSLQVLREYILPTLAETEGARRRTAEKCARAEAAPRARSMRLQVPRTSPSYTASILQSQRRRVNAMS